MISQKEWIMIHTLYDSGVPKSQIARRLGIDRKTVDKALSNSRAPEYQRVDAPSKLDSYRDHIRTRLNKYPDLLASALFQEIHRQGYDGSYDLVKRFVRQIRPPKPVDLTVRFETAPGEQAQVDWADFGRPIINGEPVHLYCFAFTLGFSRALYLEFTTGQDLVTFARCHLNALRSIDGIPEEILYDNVKTVVLSRAGNRAEWNPKFLDFARYYGFMPTLCEPGRAQTKGKIERIIGYIRHSFFRGLEFSSLEELNAKALWWASNIANKRIHRTTGIAPEERLKEEQLALKALPERDYALEVVEPQRSSKDCLVRWGSNKYSVPSDKGGRDVLLRVTRQNVVVEYQGKIIANHEMSRGCGQTIIDPRHRQGLKRVAYSSANKSVRQAFLERFPECAAFLEGVQRSKMANAKYHLAQVLALAEEFPVDIVAEAIKRAIGFGAFESKYVRRIVRSGAALELYRAGTPKPVRPASVAPELARVNVQARPLSEYERFQGRGV